MRRCYFSLWLVSVAFSFTLTHATAFADPITSRSFRITSGTVELDWGDIFMGWGVAGPDFSLLLGGPQPRRPDLTIRDGFVNPSFSANVPVRGTLRIDGQTLESGNDTPWILNLHVDAPSVRPLIFEDDFRVVLFPFNLQASLVGTVGDQRFRHEFSGSGRGAINGSSGIANFGDLRFEDTAPVPEPGTLLLATVAAFVALARARGLSSSSNTDEV